MASGDSLQEQLEDFTSADRDGVRTSHPEATIADPAALLEHLDVSGHFHRDGRMGRAFHRGQVSLREDVAEGSLHVSAARSSSCGSPRRPGRRGSYASARSCSTGACS